MKDSIIINFFIRFFNTLKVLFENSFYYKIWNNIMVFFGKLFSKSFIYYFFTKVGTKTENSLFSKTIVKLFEMFNSVADKPCNFFKNQAKKSYAVKYFMFMYNNWQYISVRYYGITLLSFGGISGALDSVNHGFISNRWLLITFLGAILSLFNTSLSMIVSGEFFVEKFSLNIFKTPKTLELRVQNAITISIIAGSILSLCNLVSGLLFLIVALIGIVIAFINPHLVILGSIAVLPFVPTMILVGLMFLSMICKLIKSREKIKFDGFDLAAVGLIFMNLYGVICSQTPANSFKIAAVYIVFLLFFFFARRTLKNHLFLALGLFITAATIVGGYGIYEYAFGLTETTWQDAEMFEELVGRVCSTFENPNVLGEFFLLSLPLTVVMLFYVKSLKTQFLVICSAIIQAICLVLTYSRGCWLGIILAIGIILVFLGKKLFILMTAGVFALPLVIPRSVIDRFLSIGNTSDSSTSYRIYIWEGTFRMLKDTWLYGIGLGTAAFNAVYPRYALGAISAPHPHNLYLLILSETGLIGILMFLFVIIYLYKNLGYVAYNVSHYKPLAIGFMGAFAGYLLQGIFDNVWYNYRIYALFVIMLSFVAALKDLAEDKSNESN